MVTNIKIAIGSDHAGFELKQIIVEHLSSRNVDLIDCGTNNLDSVDYPDFAKRVADEVSNKDLVMGILVCGSGQGMAMTANRYKDVRAAICHNSDVAKVTREHNDANILCLGSRFIEEAEALKCVDVFLSTDFEGERHLKRINKI
ncbi:ribose 5-phosphate isomerase B [Pelagibacterales bacterium]|jgi:ribose 5-phosphate isomerase B|nr:ribose 5-phosphate isomerase B [Pelagibacterales bacterium]MDA9981087.1 ribose 5-phosphate isomerase B [Pelagibacterales bacterium]|tara:strand:- start:1067 stop:1501 length:435 start_codon:yes stop_codon:yes gene_type:complete